MDTYTHAYVPLYQNRPTAIHQHPTLSLSSQSLASLGESTAGRTCHIARWWLQLSADAAGAPRPHCGEFRSPRLTSQRT